MPSSNFLNTIDSVGLELEKDQVNKHLQSRNNPEMLHAGVRVIQILLNEPLWRHEALPGVPNLSMFDRLALLQPRLGPPTHQGGIGYPSFLTPPSRVLQSHLSLGESSQSSFSFHYPG